MLTRGDRQRPDSSLESLAALFLYDVCYLTRDQVFPVGKNHASQGQAMSVGAEGSAGCAAQFRQDFEGKVGLLGIGAMEAVTGAPEEVELHMAKAMDKVRAVEFPQAFLCLVWEVSHGLGEDLSGCSANPVFIHKPFYFLIMSEISSWRLSLRRRPVSGNGRFIPSLCFRAGVGQGEGWGFFCLTLKR